MDGTLLNSEHMLNDRTIAAIKSAQKAGICFVIATGRSFEQTIHTLENAGIICDYIVNSGAEVRNSKREILQSRYMQIEDCRAVHEILQKNSITYHFGTIDKDYCIGDEKNIECEASEHIRAFNQELTEDEIRAMDFFKYMASRTKVVSNFEELEKSGAHIIKVFAMSNDLEKLRKIEAELQKLPNLAIASSFENNLEITDRKAQKGIVLKEYIESLGYTMEEVMVFGDSMNDYSMLSMDFGATVAMENGMEKVKEVAKYITKSNAEDGVAHAIEELLKNRISK